MGVVLVIDDDAEIRTLMRLILESEGHETVEAKNGDDGLAALALKPDAIFLDLDMPGMTGAQYLLHLRQHPTLALTPATFVTAHGKRVQMFTQHGLAEAQVIEKPFRRKDISDALGRMLGSFKRKNLRVSLTSTFDVTVDQKEKGKLVRLEQREIHVAGIVAKSLGSKHAIELRSDKRVISVEAIVTGIVRGETRFMLTDEAMQATLSGLIEELLADSHAKPDLRRGERVRLSASVTWERNDGHIEGYLRDLSTSGAYIVTTNRPPLQNMVTVYLPWYHKGASKGQQTPELRGAEARVTRHGSDGFGCTFTSGNAEFFVALNALLSDGTVVSGESEIR